MIKSLERDVAVESLKGFFRSKPLVFVGTGASCAVDKRFGMSALKAELLQKVGSALKTDVQRNEWRSVETSLGGGVDLETALNRVSDQGLIGHIVRVTGAFVGSVDRQYAAPMLMGDMEWPALPLLRSLVETFETERTLHVMTPNYDMLIEYACGGASIPYTTGFNGEVLRRMDWSRADWSMRERESVLVGKRLQSQERQRKHVRLYKVHGSLNWFINRNTVEANDAWSCKPPSHLERLVVTPGLSKFQRAIQFRSDLLREADAAIKKAGAFLFIGYGFNDPHLDGTPEVRNKLIEQACPAVVVTRDPSQQLFELLEKADGMWLVCRVDENNSESTRVRNRRFDGWLRIDGEKWWDIRQFTQTILGI